MTTNHPLGIAEVLARLSESATKNPEPPICLALGETRFPIQDHFHFEHPVSDSSQVTTYGDIRGELALRERISHYCKTVTGRHVSPEQVLITDGGTGALATALSMLLQPGYEVIVPSIGYPVYPRLVDMFHGVAIPAPLDAEHNLDVARLPELISERTAAIIVNSPGNPQGNITSKDTLEAIAALGIPVIYDEVYQQLTFSNRAAPSALELEDPSRKFIVNSFSKAFAVPGFRIGFMIASEDDINRALNHRMLLNLCPNLPGQEIAALLLEDPLPIINAHRRYLRNCRETFVSAVNRNGLSLVREPEGGFYALLKLPEGSNSLEVCRTLATDFSVGVAPGKDFATSDPGFCRVTITADANDIEVAMSRIAQCLASRTVEYVT